MTRVCKDPTLSTNHHDWQEAMEMSCWLRSEDDFAFSVQSDIRDITTIDIELGGIQLEGVLVDSGSTCNVIDRETWETLKRKNIKCRSWKSNQKLYSYGSEEPLNTAGEFEAELCYKDRK